jgi:hypothetical protein
VSLVWASETVVEMTISVGETLGGITRILASFKAFSAFYSNCLDVGFLTLSSSSSLSKSMLVTPF